MGFDFLIHVQMGHVGFIGNMEHGLIRHAFFFQKFRERRQENIEKSKIFFRIRCHFPSENLPFFSVHCSHDLGAAFGAPLGE